MAVVQTTNPFLIPTSLQIESMDMYEMLLLAMSLRERRPRERCRVHLVPHFLGTVGW
jgi:hypothetical protein